MILQDKKIFIMGLRNRQSIAWQIAKAAKKQGAQIFFSYSTFEDVRFMQELMDEIGAKGCVCDVTSDDSIRECLKQVKQEFGKIDGLVHSIAHAHSKDLRGEFLQTSREGFCHATDVSAYSLLATCQIAVEQELFSENASIVTLTYLGAEKVVKDYKVMGIAKAALESTVRYLANDLGKRKIRVNSISAGPIATLSSSGIQNFEGTLKLVEEKSPLHKNVTGEELGEVATFLLSSMASAITGEVLHVDNGFSIVAE